MSFYFEWIPNPADLARAFQALSVRLSKFEVPLTRSVSRVISPSISTNFSVGGRPSWQPLAAYTATKKGNSRILHESGDLERQATSINSWDIGNNKATLANIDDYGVFQNFGFWNVQFQTNVPARQWAVMQDSDVDDVVDEFLLWMAEEIDDELNF